MWNISSWSRDAVWDILCDLHRNALYYTELGMKRRRWHRWLQFAILIGIVTDAGFFYIGVTHTWAFYAGLVVFALLAVVTVRDVTFNYAESAAIARLTAYACDDLYRETNNLWMSIEDNAISRDDVVARYNSITERWARYTERVPPERDESLLSKTQEESDEFMSRRRHGA